MFELNSPKFKLVEAVKGRNLILATIFLFISLVLIFNVGFFSIIEISARDNEVLIQSSFLKEDQKNLETLFKKMQINWQGEDFKVEVDQKTLNTLNKIGKISLRIKIRGNQINFYTRSFLKEDFKTNSWSFKNWVSRDSLIYLQFPKNFLPPFSGREAYNYTEDVVSATLLPANVLKFAFFGKINDMNSLKKTVEDFKNLPQKGAAQERYEGVASGYSEGLIGEIKTYTLTTPESKLAPTFAVIDDILITTFDAEFLKEIIATSKNKNLNLQELETFKETIEELPNKSDASLFINIKKIKDYGLIRLFTEIKPYLNIELSNESVNFLQASLEKIENFSLVSSRNKLVGFLKLQ